MFGSTMLANNGEGLLGSEQQGIQIIAFKFVWSPAVCGFKVTRLFCFVVYAQNWFVVHTFND